MHGHFCLHDLIVFLTMIWEGLTCCVTCGRHMLYAACKRFKHKSVHVHRESQSCSTCTTEEYRAQTDP